MKRLFVAFGFLTLCAVVSVAQKGKAEPDYYPMGYSGDTWSGEVTAFDNKYRTLTLTHTDGKDVVTFVASIPDAPYELGRDLRNFRVVDFPYKKDARIQVFKYEGSGTAVSILPKGDLGDGMQRRPSPPASNVISDLAEFKGRSITVFYSVRDREVNGQKEKYNDVWRIRVFPAKKKP
jgi:hypothetical protein